MMTFYLSPRKSLFYFLFIFIFYYSYAQPPQKRISKEEYIRNYKEEAIKSMIKTGIPASIVLAQAILESDNGNSLLAAKANNHFGIKCHSDWNGARFIMDDDIKNECFRKYNSVLESYEDHSLFLKTRSRYAFLFNLPDNNYKAWAEGLKKAGYATNPNYPELLIKIIEENKLFELDRHSSIKIHKTVSSSSKPNINLTAWLFNNNVKYVIAEKEDTYIKIANKYEMALWQLYKYNEKSKYSSLTEGEKVYLQPKRKKASQDFHIVKEGESMYFISQLYAVKLKHLYKKNLMEAGTEPVTGQKLYLKNKKEI